MRRSTHPRTLARACRRAFSLTELMVAVAVLIVVIIATSKIFSTAGQITAAGTATTSLLRTAAVIEKQMRDDLARLAPDGFFAIHCVAVRNDVRGPAVPLLDPTKPADFVYRCDQLMFFTDGVQGVQTYRQGAGSNRDGQGSAARVYYGHAFQLPNALPAWPSSATELRAHDPAFPALTAFSPFSWTNQIPPWFPDSVNRPGLAAANSPLLTMTGTRFLQNSGASEYTTVGTAQLPAQINAQQPPPHQWILGREAIVLADDDINTAANDPSKAVFLANNRSLFSLFAVGSVQNTAVRKGRVDACAQLMNEVRQYVTQLSSGCPNPWMSTSPGASQRMRIQQAMYYPRAERKAPGMSRVDQALTNGALGVGISSFRIDWTYENGVGQATDAFGVQYAGVYTSPAHEHPWFGLTDQQGSVYNYVDDTSPVVTSGILTRATTIDPNNIEHSPLTIPALPAAPAGVADYWAVFGYNQTMPFLQTPALGGIDPDAAMLGGCASNGPRTGIPSRSIGVPATEVGYTPWPSAIRVTMVLHDPDGKLEGGREFQFVINLPTRVP